MTILKHIYLADLPDDEWKITEAPRSGQNHSGYGKRVPTRHMVKLRNRWRRVYCYIFSNIGTCYIEEPGGWITVSW